MLNLKQFPNYPFTSKHLVKLRRELRKEGGAFDALMVKKQALLEQEGAHFIALYEDIEDYKRNFLTGAYATLRPYFQTRTPYIFWSRMYMALVKAKVA